MAAAHDAAADRAGSLADWLRARDDRDLVALLQRRPDLALPAPADITTLAARVSVRTSVQRAVDGLDELRLAVLEAALLISDTADRFTAAQLRELAAGADTDAVASAVNDLLGLALLWGTPDELHVPGGVREVIG